MSTHVCGGTILQGGSGAYRHLYCDRCSAFRYFDEETDESPNDIPSGTDRAHNRAAYDGGERESPSETEERGCPDQ